jgi:hypothetical protein
MDDIRANMSHGLREKVEKLERGCLLPAYLILDACAEAENSFHQEFPGLDFLACLKEHARVSIRTIRSKRERIEPKLRSLQHSAWAIDEPTLHQHFGDIVLRSERFLTALVTLSAQIHDFSEAVHALRLARRVRELRITKSQGVRKHDDWQPMDVDAVIRDRKNQLLRQKVPELEVSADMSPKRARSVDEQVTVR